MALLLLALAGLLTGGVPEVRAQAGPVLAVLPSDDALATGQVYTVSLYLTGGVEVNAFDLIVEYDAEVLALNTWEYGDYLSNLTTVIKPVNEPGLFHLVVTQLVTPPVSGDGTLLELTFEGLQPGLSSIRITKADFDGNNDPWLEEGRLLVHTDPSTLPSCVLRGRIDLQGSARSAGVPVRLGYGRAHWLGPYAAITAAGSGDNLTIPGVAPDTYPVYTAMPRYLNLPGSEITLGSNCAPLAPLMLLGGNAVWQVEVDGVLVLDETIDAADLALVEAQYLQSGAGLDGDVNFSGRVDIFDLALVAGNYGRTAGESYHFSKP